MIVFGFVLFPLIGVTIHHAVIGAAFTASAVGESSLAERLFKTISHSDYFIGNESVALYKVSSAGKVDERQLRTVLISNYGGSSNQLAKFDYEFGVRYLDSKDWINAERSLSESAQISSEGLPDYAQITKLMATSKLAIATANLEDKERARTLIKSTLSSLSSTTRETKLKVLTNLLNAALTIDDDPQLTADLLSARRALESPALIRHSVESSYSDLEIIALSGVLLLLTYVAAAASEFCLLSVIKNRQVKLLHYAHSSTLPALYSHLIDLDLCLGQVEQANAHSICLLRISAH